MAHERRDFESLRDLGFGADAAPAVAAEAAPVVTEEESPVASSGDGAAPA